MIMALGLTDKPLPEAMLAKMTDGIQSPQADLGKIGLGNDMFQKKSTPKPTCLSSFLTLHISGNVVLLKSIYWWIWLEMISVNICAENQVYIHDDFS